ncbi:MAG: DUF2156 domain-containing protein [Clostridia bacterium]|nr:DUF2156 domain-containing protein [Clostridia bacterium]
MQFSTLTDAHIDKCRPYFELLSHPTCDYTVGGVFMWRDLYNIEYACNSDCLFIRYYEESGGIYYGMPMCKDVDVADSINKLIEFERQQGSKVIRFCAIPKEYLDFFEKIELKSVTYPQPDFFDYLYSAENLITLSGKKYGGQRNLISQFCRLYEERFEKISAENIDDVRSFFDSFSATDMSDDKNAENDLVGQVLNSSDMYGMFGGVLYANGKVAGFSVGEQVGDTLYVHIEKADRGVKGAYQTLNNRFAACFGKNAEYINREDDAGDEGLRKAKLAYHPVKLLEKFVVEFEL